ncbi:hypothetical protein BJ508DRAFT_313483 [Ascobolus immersus RN42]|uniref:Uncharacterized protein n=1 Tax=Ascobolus immersus RN42 TaxID=1160509 RepID=A0A3N4HIL5_ASCIM|nr:hypothetical protein BJ508DRAFT_313483 [Ascobolus immersus RN42]
MIAPSVLRACLLLSLQLGLKQLVNCQLKDVIVPIRDVTMHYQGRDQYYRDVDTLLIRTKAERAEFEAMHLINGGRIPSEFNDYYTWLRNERCYSLWCTGSCPEWMPNGPGYWEEKGKPECPNFIQFQISHPSTRYKAMQHPLYQDFLRFNFTFDNPQRWVNMPEAYRIARRVQFGNSDLPRECSVGISFSNRSPELLFSTFGYLKPDPRIDLTAMADRAKCERITWVEDTDSRASPPASAFIYFPEREAGYYYACHGSARY